MSAIFITLPKINPSDTLGIPSGADTPTRYTVMSIARTQPRHFHANQANSIILPVMTRVRYTDMGDSPVPMS